MDDTKITIVDNKPEILAKDCYETPEYIWRAVLDFIGHQKFHVDPCASWEPRPYSVQAYHKFNYRDHNSLAMPWWIFSESLEDIHIWLNPPYSNYELWLTKALEHVDHKGAYVWCLLNQSNASFWQETINQKMKFKINLQSRVKFYMNDVQQTSPRYDNVIVHFGPDDRYSDKLRSTKYFGNVPGEVIFNIDRLISDKPRKRKSK